MRNVKLSFFIDPITPDGERCQQIDLSGPTQDRTSQQCSVAAGVGQRNDYRRAEGSLESDRAGLSATK